MKQKIIVIGSGFGGLGAAIRLAARGHEVEIFEKRDKLGGRAYQYEINGFKFDGGPTVITAPYMFDELFEEAGKHREDYFNLVPLDPFYRIFDHKGSHFDYHRNLDDTLSEIERWNPADRDGYLRLTEHIRSIFNRFHPFTDRSFIRLVDMLRIMPDMIRLQAYTSSYHFISKYIKNEFLRRVFSFHPLLVGGNPFDTPSIYTLIVQFERQWGVHYALGGTGALVKGLGKLFNDLGGKVHFNAEVEEILVKGRKAYGVRLKDGRTHHADTIISNGDVAFTYRNLIPVRSRKTYPNIRIDSMRYSMSLFVIYFGTKRRYLDSKLKHHNIILNDRYRELLSDIFNKQKLTEDFSLYLHMPSITDPSTAPEGCESFYVLSCVPNLSSGTDWEKIGIEYRDRVLQFLEENYLPDLRENIIALHHIDPLHFQNTLNSYKGAAFSVKPSLMQSAWFRPHNRAEDIHNLYFVGAGTHPGAGVPAVLSSGKIAANLIDPGVSYAQQPVFVQEDKPIAQRVKA
jgi:phytoene desaturase